MKASKISYSDLTESKKIELLKKSYVKDKNSFADIASDYNTYANKLRRDAKKFNILNMSPESTAYKLSGGRGNLPIPTEYVIPPPLVSRLRDMGKVGQTEEIMKSVLDFYKKYGGDLPKAQRGIVTKLIKEGSKKLDEIIPIIRSYFKNADEFKSKIDWGKWNKEIPNNKALMEEYNSIEKLGKENGTWMKNPDGSMFTGTPEQWVQQRSANYIKAFGESKLLNTDGSPMILYHGSPKKFDAFDKSMYQLGDSGYSGSGIYTTPSKTIAEGYTTSGKRFHDGEIEPTLYELYGRGNNPITSQQLIDNSGGDIGFGKVGELIDKNLPTNLFNFHRKGAPTVDQLLKYDVAIHNQNRGITNIRPIENAWEIVFPTNKQLKSAVGNNGMFDMSNPNIYKQEGGEEREEFIAPFSKEDWEYYRSKFKPTPYPPPGITPTPEPESELESKPVASSYTILSPESLLRQAFAESTFRPDAVSPMDARGIAQFRPITIKEMQRLGIVDDTFDPFDINQAIPAQRAYMTYLSERPQLTQGSEESINSKILFAYNRGLKGAVEELTNLKNKGVEIYKNTDWVDQINDESSNYVKKIYLKSNDKFNKEYEDALTNDKYKSIRDLYFKRSGGESKIYKVYKDYINGNATDKNSEMVYDKLNRIHYKDAKQAGMGVPNYIMSYLVGNS